MKKLNNASCPKCEQQMKNGYVYSTRQIFWSTDGKSRIFDFQGETLVELPLLKSKKVPAYRCEDCKIVIFQYE